MKLVHKLALSLKIIFILLLILINIIPSFTKEAPVFIITHDLLIIILCVYLIYISFPFGRRGPIEMEKEDFLFVFIVCLMLLRTVDFKKFFISFRPQKKTTNEETESNNMTISEKLI